MHKNVKQPLMETSERPLGTVSQLQKQHLVAGGTNGNFCIIHWFCGSVQVLLFTAMLMKECEGFKVRSQGCQSRVYSFEPQFPPP